MSLASRLTALSTRAAQAVKASGWRGDLELADRAADHATGALTEANTGQAPILKGYKANVADTTAHPKIVSGRLVTDATTSGNLGSFASYTLSGPVLYQRARWTYSTAGTANTGSVGIISWAPGFTGTPTTLPESNCHLSISPAGWQYAIIYLGTFYGMTSGTFATPLVQDGVTVHTCEVVHDIIGGTEVVYLYLPDGTIKKMPTLGALTPTATQAAFEIYKEANGDKNVEIIDWAADSRRSRALQARLDYATSVAANRVSIVPSGTAITGYPDGLFVEYTP